VRSPIIDDALKRPALGVAFFLLVAAFATLGDARGGTTVVDGNAIYPEGPLWLDGVLYYVEYGGPGVKAWDGGRPRIHWSRAHCGPSGVILFGDHHLLIACYDSNSLVEIDTSGKTVRVIDRDSGGKPFIGPNDFTADGRGGVYLSASGVYDLAAPITGKILHLTADGRLVALADTIHYPNGLTRSRDGTQLLVAEMLAARILSFPILPDGGLGERHVWARLQDIIAPTTHADAFNGPDGFKLGPDGNYYIAQNGSGRVLVVDGDRHLVRTVEVDTPYVTNVNFGPGATLYITGVFDPWKEPYPGAVYRWQP
jgi:sugar lactone lactonase YvrE